MCLTDDIQKAVGRELTESERWAVGLQVDQDTCHAHYRFCCPDCFAGCTDDDDAAQTVIAVSDDPVVWSRVAGFMLAVGPPDPGSMTIEVLAT